MKTEFLISIILGLLMCIGVASCTEDIEPLRKVLPTDVPDDKIYYKTPDNTIIPIEYGTEFGDAKVVSNTNSSLRGYGILKFDTIVSVVREKVFADTYIISVALPGTIKEIRDSAFVGCTYFDPIVLPKSLKRIGSFAFKGCKKVAEVAIPDSVQYIGASAFADCTNLAEVSLGSGVQTLSAYCFARCELSKFTVRALTPPALDQTVFEDAILEDAILYVPKGYKRVYKSSEWGQYFDEIEELKK